MVEKVQKACLRSLFRKEYGYYPFKFPTRLLLGMLGYNSLLHRRDLALLHFQVMRGAISCPTLLHRIGQNVPNNFLRGRHHEYLAVPASRTNLYRTAPLPRAIRYIHMKEGRLSEIASSYLFRLLYRDEKDENVHTEYWGNERFSIAMILTVPLYFTLYFICTYNVLFLATTVNMTTADWTTAHSG
jgi:hypothetical protein